MSTEFEADDAQIAMLLAELAGISAYAQELGDQVGLRASSEAVAWTGQAAASFNSTLQRWRVEETAMIAEVQNFTDWVANAKAQYGQAGDATSQGWG